MISGRDYDKFSKVDELVEAIDMGLDIEFFIEKVRYNISWASKDTVFISICPDGGTSYYKNADDLLNHHFIGGKPLKELWQDIEVYAM